MKREREREKERKREREKERKREREEEGKREREKERQRDKKQPVPLFSPSIGATFSTKSRRVGGFEEMQSVLRGTWTQFSFLVHITFYAKYPQIFVFSPSLFYLSLPPLLILFFVENI